jgi:hypothetical protein
MNTKLDRTLLVALMCWSVAALGFAFLVADMWLMPFRFFVSVAGVASVVLLPLALHRRTPAKTGVYLAFLLGLLFLWGVPWSPRKAFFQNVWFLHKGMTVEQVETRMAPWAANPSGAPSAYGKMKRPVPPNFTGYVGYGYQPTPTDQCIQVHFENGRATWVGYHDD